MESNPQKKKEEPSSKPSPKQNDYLKFSGIAFELTAYNIICVWGGYELSERYSPKYHWILILAVLVAVTGTIYYLFKRLNS